MTSLTPLPTCAIVGGQSLDLLGRFRRALGERPHFRGDDREAAARFARARGLDAGVERQQVGLEGDLVDDADDLADLRRRPGDGAHRLDRVAHDDGALTWRPRWCPKRCRGRGTRSPPLASPSP